MELFRNRTLRRVSLAMAAAAVVALGACSDGTSPAEPVIPETPEPVPGLRAASFVADVNLAKGTVDITSPKAGLDFNAIADYFGLEPGHPELSILGGDVVEVIPDPLSLTFGAPNATSLKRRVAFRVTIQNRLQGAALTGSTQLPIPPAGITSPVIFPFENIATTTQGGVTGSNNDVIVEMPSGGAVFPSDTIWTGPEHNFFNDESCGASENDCFLYKKIVEASSLRDTIGGLGASEPVRLGWDVDLTVHQFRSRIIMAADLTDATPNVLPTAAFTAGACVIGSPVTLDASASSDSDGFIASYAWDFGNDGTTDATGNPATFTPPATPGTVAILLTVTDNRSGQDTDLQTLTCDYPPAEAFVDIELQNSAGQPVTEVAEGGTYRIVWTQGNASPVTPLTNYVNVYDLDEAIVDLTTVTFLDLSGNPIAVPSAYNPATGTFSRTLASLPAGTTGGHIIVFQILQGVAPGPFAFTATSDSDEGAGTPDETESVSVPVTVPPNVMGRWIVAGAPATTATVGQVAYLQICTTEPGIEAIDAQIQTPGVVGTIIEVRNFESDGSIPTAAGLVHPDCVGSADELDDFFFPNLTSPTSANFGLSALTPPSTGRVGIAEVRVAVNQAGTLTPTLNIPNFQVSGAQGTATPNIQTLTATN